MKTYSIKITVDRIKGENAKGKYDFLSSKGIDASGHYADFKFTRACLGAPQNPGVYLMLVDSDSIRKDKRTVYNVYWISNVKELKPYDEVKEAVCEDDLPF